MADYLKELPPGSESVEPNEFNRVVYTLNGKAGSAVGANFFASNPASLKNLSIYNVKTDYGAKGDSVTLDDTALLAAHTAIPSGSYATGEGGDIRFPMGVYAISVPFAVSKQNVKLSGANWSVTVPNFSFSGSPNLPGSVLKPTLAFPANRWALEVNNTALQVTGFTLEDLAFDGGNTPLISGVGAIRLSNVVGSRGENFTIGNKFSGDGITIDQSGATYSPPSTSQLWFHKFIMWDLRGNGISIGNNFMSEIFIGDFMVGKIDISGIGTSPSQSSANYDIHIRDGYIGPSTTGLSLYTSDTFVDNLFIDACYGNGLYVKRTTGTANRKSYIRNVIVFNPDTNVNGTSAVIMDAGCLDYLLDGIVCVRATSGEIGINIVDGLATFLSNGNQLSSNCRAYGFTTANFKYGATNYSQNYPPTLAPSTVTAGASPWTYTNNDGFPEILTLTTVAGISALTWKGIAGQPITAQAFGFYLAPSDTLIATWAATAPVFTKYPVSTGY